MVTDVLVHFSLELLGALGLRAVLGMCRHPWHRLAVWAPFALGSSWLTVALVG